MLYAYGRLSSYLLNACENGNLNVVKLLLHYRSAGGHNINGIDVNKADNYGKTLLYILCENRKESDDAWI